MKHKNWIRRISIVLAGAVLVLTVLVGASILFPRFSTGLLFGVDVGPVDLALQSAFVDRETDAKTSAIKEAAAVFLASLDPAQKQAATYAFSDNAQRSNWSNFPEGMIPRGGLKLGKMSAEQRELLDALLAVVS